MATLTETAYYTRKAINWGIVAAIALLILKILLDFTFATWRKLFPPPPPPPTVAFGKLPAINFPQLTASPAAKLQFSLETIEGGPPVASSTGTIYFMPRPAPNLLSLTRAKQFASRLRFVDEPLAENSTLYRWQDSQNPFRSLRIDIVNNNFVLAYDFAADLGLFAEKNLPSREQAVAEAINFLQNLRLYTPDLAAGQTKVTYWQLVGNTLVQTTSLSGADAVRVDFARQDVDNLKLFPPNPDSQLIHFTFSGNRSADKRILEASYKFWQIEKEQKATYPLKTSEQAFEELRNGGGFIAHLTGRQTNIIIRKIYLAYFYPEEPQEFLQPIFVFEGDPNFIGFVSAVSPAWVVSSPAK